MRAGAIPLLVWSLLVGALFAVHWVWTEDTLQNATFGFAIGVVLATAALLVAGDRDALRRGEPAPRRGVEAVPQSSLGAPLVAISIVAAGFGLVFGSFLVFIGAGLFVAAVGLLGLELRDQRRVRRLRSDAERDA